MTTQQQYIIVLVTILGALGGIVEWAYFRSKDKRLFIRRALWVLISPFALLFIAVFAVIGSITYVFIGKFDSDLLDIIRILWFPQQKVGK